MGWERDDDLVTRTIVGWHGGRLPVGADKGATMTDEALARQTAETRAARAATRLRGVTARDPDERTGGYRAARGAVPRRAGDPTPEEAIRRGRDGDDDELAALRAAVARLEGEREYWRQQWEHEHNALLDMAEREAAAVAERDAARAALDGLIADLEHFAQTSHQAHHGAYAATWQECPRGSCPGLRRAVARARAAREGGEG